MCWGIVEPNRKKYYLFFYFSFLLLKIIESIRYHSHNKHKKVNIKIPQINMFSNISGKADAQAGSREQNFVENLIK
jgi:hypothetical protein